MDPRLRARQVAVRARGRPAPPEVDRRGRRHRAAVLVGARAADPRAVPLGRPGARERRRLHRPGRRRRRRRRAIKGAPMLTARHSASARRSSRPARGCSEARVEQGLAPRRAHRDRRAHAAWPVYRATDGQWRVVDDEGRVLAAAGGPARRLPGHRADRAGLRRRPGAGAGQQVPPALADAVRLAPALPRRAEGQGRSRSASTTDGRAASSTCSPQGTVLLGSADDMRDKLIAVLTVLHKVDPDHARHARRAGAGEPRVRTRLQILDRRPHRDGTTSTSGST